ncbi:HNH endonuclease [Frigoribacterium sp. CFBP 8759]|nr:HNH endonuclease [Frigoribacterium sp. CFBP 8759]
MLKRDAWTCQICQLPIARDAHVHDDLSPAVDHIIPRRDGGGDELENLRAAHR